MDIRIFNAHELRVVLSALRSVAVSEYSFTEGERALVEGLAHIHQQEIAAHALTPVTFAEVARVVVDPQHRKRAVQLAIVMSLVEGTPSQVVEQRVRDLARALGVPEAGLKVLWDVSHGHALLARFDMFRRMSRFIRSLDGFPGMWKMAPAMLGIAGNDVELRNRYYALANCAPGTLGRAVFDHFYANDFKMPGEPGGIPMVFHDLGHVLAGYGTDPQGEIRQAAFQAGFARHDGFSVLLFGILQFHLGLRVTPIAQGFSRLFHVPSVLEALARGAACKVDLSAYDFFPDKDRALDEVRHDLGIVPALECAA